MHWLRRHWKGATASAVIVIAALVVGVPYVYIHAIEGSSPAPLALPVAAATTSSSGTAAPATSSVAGSYTVGSGSKAGYRVHEVLAGQSTTAVGRTSKVTGKMVISGHTITTASFTVDMASVTSDRSQRDGQFRGRIMDTAKYPTGTFVLTKPIALASVPPAGKVVSVPATGRLTLHGTTRQVTLTLKAERVGAAVEVTADAPIRYGDYGIDNPSFGGFVSVGNSGDLEVLLDLVKA
jgi:polyisoprenoid-binding protein YceI